MRLFIAVNFNDNTRSRLLALRDELRSRSVRGNFSFPENLHLTLIFLGECDTKQLAGIKDIMNTTTFAPFDLSIEHIGRFKRSGGDIWWAGLSNSKPLLDLQQELTEKFLCAGFTLDTRKYNPHITLGREIITDMVPWNIELFGETVTSIELMKSERAGSKLVYTAVHKKSAD